MKRSSLQKRVSKFMPKEFNEIDARMSLLSSEAKNIHLVQPLNITMFL
jgi:hypothetical protein